MNRATPNLTAPGDCPDFRAAKMGLSPSARPARGISLLEVLIAIFVVTIGLLGLVTLVPVGGFAVNEAAKADRSGACGRAALREIKIQRMLDIENWYTQQKTGSYWYPGNNVELYPVPGVPPLPEGLLVRNPRRGAVDPGPFAIDPLGYAAGSRILGEGGEHPIPRITLLTVGTGKPMPQAVAERIFTWADDLQFAFPEDADPPPADESTRPRAVIDATGLPQSTGNYTWFITVTPAEGEKQLALTDHKRLYSVSAVVCYDRSYRAFPPPTSQTELEQQLDKGGEQVRKATFLGGIGYGGGSIRLDWPVEVREREWIMLCDGRHCKWYRVSSAGSSPTNLLTLTGPDWDTGPPQNRRNTATAVIIDSVVGVYSTTVEL